jgi:cyclohexanecarboxylate-CoA ligase
VFDRACRERPQSQIEYRGAVNVVVTFADVCRVGTAIAGGLTRLGLRHGDVLLAQLPNCPEGTVLLYAAMRLGAVIVPVVDIYGPTELEFIARDAGAVCAVIAESHRGLDNGPRAKALARVGSIRHVITVGEDRGAGDVHWPELGVGTTDLPPLRVDPDARCLISYTSGTTAVPKGVQHTHNTLLGEVRTVQAAFQRSARDSFLQAQPAGHIAGVLGLLRAVHNRVEHSIVLTAWDPMLAARAVHQDSISSTTGPPYYLVTLLEAAEREHLRLDSLRDYMTGGERVSPALVERAERAGVVVYRSYGSSEHPTVTSSAADSPLSARATTDGRALPGTSVQVVDPEGQPVPTGAAGEVITTGPEQFVGYTDDLLNDSAFLENGWFRTGDVGHLDSTGVLTITDRIKDIVIRGGENISAQEVEGILSRHPAVRDVAIIAVHDPRYGERTCAVVSLRQGGSLDLAGVRDHFEASGVARQKTPERLEIVEEFPRTGAGKIRKDELRRRLDGREPELGGTDERT